MKNACCVIFSEQALLCNNEGDLGGQVTVSKTGAGMKTILTKLPDKQARKELKPYTLYAWLAALFSYYVLGRVGLISVFFGTRTLLLTYRKGNKKRRFLLLYRFSNILAIAIGGYGVYLFWARL
jgi:hypothetical protein